MKMKLDGDAKFLYFTMTQAAIKMKKIGKTEKDFLEFAKGIWESMLLTPIDKLEGILMDAMISYVKKYVDE